MSERSLLLIFNARDYLVKVSSKSNAWKCQNQVTSPYFDQLSERASPFDNEHFLNYCFPEDRMILILNGYRKRAVCRKHKVEPGNWSFDPTGALLQPAAFQILISAPFLSQFSGCRNIQILTFYKNDLLEFLWHFDFFLAIS